MEKERTLPQKAILELVKIAIGTSDGTFDFSQLSRQDWAGIIRESKNQAVCLLCFDAAGQVKEFIPQDIFKEWLQVSAQYLTNNMRVLQSQNDLVQLMEDNGLSYIILKGFAAASYYPAFEKRSFGDVDFLILPEQQSRVEQVLLDAGYKKELEGHVCHRVFKKEHAHLEMHFELAGIPTGPLGDVFREYLTDAATKYTVHENPSFHNPSPEIHAIVLLLHTIHHMLSEGLGLRHLCDWACFVHQTAHDPFWESDVLPLLRKTGSLKFAAAITKTSALLLGTNCPAWVRDIPDSLCHEIMDDIFALGNFGRKNRNLSASGQMISVQGASGTENGKIKNLFGVLTFTMYSAYPFLKKWKILYPFFFVWRIIKYLFLLFCGKRRSIFKANAYVSQRKSVYDQFALYQVTKQEKKR